MRLHTISWNKLLFSAIIALGILAIVFLASNIKPFSTIIQYSNLGVRNVLFSVNIFGAHTKIHPSLALVSIDDKTLEDTDSGGLWRWQNFDRSYYAKVIDNLNKAGAIVIGVDVLFSEKANGDDELAESIKKAGNVVLGASIDVKSSKEILLPTEKLKENAYSVGFFEQKVNPVNNLVYSTKPVQKLPDKTVYEPLGLSVLRKYLDTIENTKTPIYPDVDDYDDTTHFHTGKYEFVPLSGKGEDRREILIHYAATEAGFANVSFVDVYKNTFNPSLVKDRIVLVGATATALHDEFFTPLWKTMPGVVVHLNFINTILEQAYLSYVSPIVEYLVILMLALFLTIFLMYVENRVYQLAYSFVFLTIGMFFYLVVYDLSNKIFTHPTEIIMTVILIAISVTSYKYIYEEKGKRLLKSTLSQYLAEDLVTSVLSNYQEVRLGGTKKEVTLFFSDIAGFTTHSEEMEPEELVRFLSLYLKEVSDIIINDKGFINKYEGDAVMAIWGAFMLEKRQSFLACRAALAQQRMIKELNVRFKQEFGFEISVRMGINKGLAVVGNIGSMGRKIEYTALGDTVNTASRFEGINKLYQTKIIVGESIARDEREHFVFRKLDSIMVKGKNLSVLIYELVGAKEEVTEDELAKIAQYEVALGFYHNRLFEDANKIFDGLVKKYQDGPSITMLERAEYYLKNGCPADWKGEYRAIEK